MLSFSMPNTVGMNSLGSKLLEPRYCEYPGNMRFCIQNAVHTMENEVLHPNWCKYHGNMRSCIQNGVNNMDMKDSRSGSRGP